MGTTVASSGNAGGRWEGKRRVVPTSVAPITFFVREDSDWMQPRNPEDTEADERVLTESARTVAEFLRKRGASFFADIVRGTELLKAEVETALWELVAAGLVTADGFENLRTLINPNRRATPGTPKIAKPRHTTGRWSLLYTAEVADRNKTLEATCQMLLRRYGVVFREVLARESNLPKWRELLIAYRRLEDRGEVRGGRFVNGFLGEQFALPDAVESLRAMRKLPATGRDSGSFRSRSTEPGGLHRSRRAHACDLGKIREVPRWSGRRSGRTKRITARGGCAVIDRELIEGIDYYVDGGMFVFTARVLARTRILLHVGMQALPLRI